MGFTSDAHGKPHWRGTKCVSQSCQGQALEPGSLRLTWSASRKHRCQAEPPRAGQPAFWELPGNSGHAEEARTPAPAPSLHSSRPAKAGHGGASAAGLKCAVATNPSCLFLTP